MTSKTLISTAAIAFAIVSYAGLAHAQDTIVPAATIPATVATPSDAAATIDASATDASVATTTDTAASTSTLSDTDELASLKLRVADPSTGAFMRFILKFKIRQLENQLNVKNALK